MVWVRGGSGVSGPASGGPGWFASPTLTPRYPPCLCLSCPDGLAIGRSWSMGANEVGILTSLGGGPSTLCACSRVSRAGPCAWLRSGHTSRGIALLLRHGLALRSLLTLRSLGGGEAGSFSATKNGTRFSGDRKGASKSARFKSARKSASFKSARKSASFRSAIKKNWLQGRSPREGACSRAGMTLHICSSMSDMAMQPCNRAKMSDISTIEACRNRPQQAST